MGRRGSRTSYRALITLVISAAISSTVKSDVLRATLSASEGLLATISSLEMLCHKGRMICSPVISWVTRPSNSYWGQFLEKKACERTTTPNLLFAKPASIFCRRLSPIFSSNSSYQTFRPCCKSALARGRTIESLSSVAWEMKDSSFLVRCLEVAAADRSNLPLILALDALDEADWRLLPRRVNVHYLPLAVPPGVYVVASTRPDRDIPLEVARRRNLDMEQDSKGNLLDIRAYLQTYSRRSGIHTRLVQWGIDVQAFVTELSHKSQGNFMYLHYVLPAIEAGRLGRGGVGELPEGLQAYYQGHWAQMKEEFGGGFGETHERVICVLAVMTEPVSLDEVAEWTALQRQ